MYACTEGGGGVLHAYRNKYFPGSLGNNMQNTLICNEVHEYAQVCLKHTLAQVVELETSLIPSPPPQLLSLAVQVVLFILQAMTAVMVDREQG